MRAAQPIIETLGWNERGFRKTLAGLSPEQLRWQPKADANPIGWLLWHGTRVEDRTIADLRGTTQAWIDEGWHARFGRPADPLDRGFGHAIEQVRAFASPDAATLQAYHDSVRRRTVAYLSDATPTEFERAVPTDHGPSAVAQRIANLVNEMLVHDGQAAYVRGLLQGAGWFGA
ncbi:MAG: DinB family protein [SAR202 cluster bacterium]|nr:DinB family protein [SAR202 cluster bacterium]